MRDHEDGHTPKLPSLDASAIIVLLQSNSGAQCCYSPTVLRYRTGEVIGQSHRCLQCRISYNGTAYSQHLDDGSPLPGWKDYIRSLPGRTSQISPLPTLIARERRKQIGMWTTRLQSRRHRYPAPRTYVTRHERAFNPYHISHPHPPSPFVFPFPSLPIHCFLAAYLVLCDTPHAQRYPRRPARRCS